MQVDRLAIADVIVIKPRRFGDPRGYFAETFNGKHFRQTIAEVVFVQDNEALSGRVGTIRGLHFQKPPSAQGKLLRVLRGAVFDVAVDVRRGSPTYGRHVSIMLDAGEGAQIWVPPGFAHGYCTLEPDTVVAYKVTDYYSPADDAGVLWSDPAIGIDWPLGAHEALVSEKDCRLPLLRDLPPAFKYTSAS